MKDPLTPLERTRLIVMLNPYRDRFTGLRKEACGRYGEYILLQFTERGYVATDEEAPLEEVYGPEFLKGLYFKGLEPGKYYAAEELSLW